MCQLCKSTEKTTKHHLIPRVKHKQNLKRKLKTQNLDINETIDICSLCHTTIHALFSETELRDSLNTKESLLANDKFKNYLNWRNKHLKFSSKSTKLSKN